MTANLRDLKVAWERKLEEELLPLIKPAPSTPIERSALVKGLVTLVAKCGSKARGTRPLMEQILGDEYRDKVKDIRKAADLLEGTGLDFEEVIQDLRRGAENIEALWSPKPSDAERRHQCLEMCREFLVANGKHAGMKEANKETGQGAGGAITLAQAVLELSTRDIKTGRGLYVSDQALRRYARRKRGDKTTKPKP